MERFSQSWGRGKHSVMQGKIVSLFQNLRLVAAEVKVKVTQSCPTLCNPMDYTVHGILQARILEWVAFPFSWARRRLKGSPLFRPEGRDGP